MVAVMAPLRDLVTPTNTVFARTLTESNMFFALCLQDETRSTALLHRGGRVPCYTCNCKVPIHFSNVFSDVKQSALTIALQCV